jgi:membrane protein DedA with SNARE-associated domain
MDVIHSSVLQLLYEHRYIFAFAGSMLEGNFTIILCGVLLKFGYFNIWGLTLALLIGYFTNGLIWYFLGRIFGHTVIEKWIKKFKFGKKVADKFEYYFQQHSVKTLFLTRITYGLSMFSFMIAGSLKMNFKKFLIVSLAGCVGWVLITVGLGYGFGAGFQTLSRATEGIALGIAIVIGVLIVLASLSVVYWMRYFARTQFVKDLEEHDSFLLSKTGEFIRKAFHHKDKKDN